MLLFVFHCYFSWGIPSFLHQNRDVEWKMDSTNKTNSSLNSIDLQFFFKFIAFIWNPRQIDNRMQMQSFLPFCLNSTEKTPFGLYIFHHLLLIYSFLRSSKLCFENNTPFILSTFKNVGNGLFTDSDVGMSSKCFLKIRLKLI